MKKVKAVVFTGYGINCNQEMEQACRMAGAEVTALHTSALFDPEFTWSQFHLMLLPGGFTFGDELGAGKALANRLSYHATPLRDRLISFVDQGGAILGVCNGFQLLVKLGLLPFLSQDLTQCVSLAPNLSGHFECRWIAHRVLPSHCIFTQGLDSLYLPIRHGEGKFVVADERIVQTLFKNRQVPLQYDKENPNGSVEAIAGICDPSGRIFGMMAHPESAIFFTQHPHWIRQKGLLKQKPLPISNEGLTLFKNGIRYLEENL